MDELPPALRRYFWDVDPEDLRLDEHRDWIVGRLLREGGWDAVRWLRRNVGDRELARWLRERDGRGLSPRRLRFWALILDLPHELVDPWVRAARDSVWGARTAR